MYKDLGEGQGYDAFAGYDHGDEAYQEGLRYRACAPSGSYGVSGAFSVRI